MRIPGVLLLVLAVLVLFAHGAVGDVNTAMAQKAFAKQAVKQKYLEWVSTSGNKHAAKETKFTAVQTGQEEHRSFANQLATTSSETIVVDQSGRGSASTVQEAVNLVPKDNNKRIIIQINPGTYKSDQNPIS